QRRMLTMLMWIASLYLWRLLPAWKRAGFYSINVMRARHPAWFREDLERLFGLLATGTIRPRVAERIPYDEVAEAHRHLEPGRLVAIWRRVGSMANSSCARTFHRDRLPPEGEAIPLLPKTHPRPEWTAPAAHCLPASRPWNATITKTISRIGMRRMIVPAQAG